MSSPAEKRLIKLLSQLHPSNADAQILKAAHAIHAIMTENKWSWEEKLAGTSTPALTEEQVQRVYTAGVQAGETAGYERGFSEAQVSMPGPKNPRTTIGDQLPWLERLLEAAAKAEADGRLTSKEVDFTRDQRRFTRQFGRATQHTQPQLDWLRGIEQSLRRRGYL